ncbi:DUF2306 domain-containing protein [Arthrobacter sp. SX1312]|uniref:DUF2306 domain-containing protein n=1 Tax=Arthrobacter sp. SX1312 TaxID=2058896 RepID=UPI000CE3192B|nr:DUF2306 domain-containing protein [Arthrobacter sp. SX1312]
MTTTRRSGRTAPRTPADPLHRRKWVVPAGLILLGLIPMLAGAARLTELAGAPEVTEQNARFVEFPVPVVLHILGATLYTLLGAFQFVPSLRQGRTWHRRAGRILFPAGLVAALTGLWMACFSALPPSDGPLLLTFRLLFGTGMVLSLLLGFRAVVRGNIRAHGAWMTRAYAIGLGAGTQALILIVPEVLGSSPGETLRALLMGAGWLVNLVVAEMVIRRRVRTSVPRRSPGALRSPPVDLPPVPR